MRTWVLVVFGVLGLMTIAVLVAAPLVEESLNEVDPVPLKITERARKLHARLFVADLHADSLLWKRDLLVRSDRGMVDLPRLQEGNVGLQVFSSVTKTPKHQNYNKNPANTDNITLLTVVQLQPPRTWFSLLQRSLWHAEKLARFVRAADGRMRHARSQFEAANIYGRHQQGEHVVGAMLSIEGLQDLEGKRENLDQLYAAGFRMAGVAHFFDNDVAGSMHGEQKGGLTPFGRSVVKRMEQLGMIVDVAHASHAAVADILRLAKRPVVSSHGGVQATCKVNRNLTDSEIRGIARTGGVIGIGYWEGAVCSLKPEAVARAIVHVKNLVGIDHVGLGSDFDGAVTTGFDVSQLAAITQALLDKGLNEEQIAKVMGLNVLRLLTNGTKPS